MAQEEQDARAAHPGDADPETAATGGPQVAPQSAAVTVAAIPDSAMPDGAAPVSVSSIRPAVQTAPEPRADAVPPAQDAPGEAHDTPTGPASDARTSDQSVENDGPDATQEKQEQAPASSAVDDTSTTALTVVKAVP